MPALERTGITAQDLSESPELKRISSIGRKKAYNAGRHRGTYSNSDEKLILKEKKVLRTVLKNTLMTDGLWSSVD
jgi:hypothetical protein